MDRMERAIEKAAKNAVKIKRPKKYQWQLYKDILEEMDNKETEDFIDDIILRINRGQYIEAKII